MKSEFKFRGIVSIMLFALMSLEIVACSYKDEEPGNALVVHGL